MLARVKYRARQLGIPFNLTEADVVIPPHCPALGIPLEHGHSRSGPNSPSLDRIIPALGYVKGNVVVISERANRIKSDASSSEIQAVASWLENLGA